MSSHFKTILGVIVAMTKAIVSEEEFKQIEAMFSGFINRMDGLLGDMEGVEGELKGLRSDMRSTMDVYEDGFSEIHKQLDAISLATKR